MSPAGGGRGWKSFVDKHSFKSPPGVLGVSTKESKPIGGITRKKDRRTT